MFPFQNKDVKNMDCDIMLPEVPFYQSGLFLKSDINKNTMLLDDKVVKNLSW